jgi:hypothetical protein
MTIGVIFSDHLPMIDFVENIANAGMHWTLS